MAEENKAAYIPGQRITVKEEGLVEPAKRAAEKYVKITGKEMKLIIDY